MRVIKKTLLQEEEELEKAAVAAKSPEEHRMVAEKGLALAD